jgi:hypothetical protein
VGLRGLLGQGVADGEPVMSHLQQAAQAALKRRNPDPERIERRNEYLSQQDDWSGKCRYCKATLTGTPAELAAHSCPEFEASNESRT